MYPPGYINGLAKKLQLLAAEFFAVNTTVWNGLVPVYEYEEYQPFTGPKLNCAGQIILTIENQ